jgi:hypothetical protein
MGWREKAGYTIAGTLAALGIAAPITIMVAVPEARFTGVPFGLIALFFALLTWYAVKCGYAKGVLAFVALFAATLAMRFWSLL